MNRRVWVPGLIAAILFVDGSAQAESVTYALYELSGSGAKALLAHGVRTYSLQDVIAESRTSGDIRWWSKEIPIANGFSAGASIFQENDLSGFGLWLKNRGTWVSKLAGGGFSWDWFDRESGDVYRKLQGKGHVRVRFVSSVKFNEIAAIEVLEDITLRVNNRPWFFFTYSDTHNLVIKKGSVLRFAQ